ncbi:unnamed protein product [Mucor hiemalis]
MSDFHIKEEPTDDVTQSRHTSFSSTSDYSTATDDGLVEGDIWSTTLQQNIVHPLDSSLLMNSWDPQVFDQDLKTQVWNDLNFPQPLPQQQGDKNYTFNNMAPKDVYNYNDMMSAYNIFNNTIYHSASTSPSGLITPPTYFHTRSSLPITTNNKKLIYMNNTALDINRRSSSGDHPRFGRRSSSTPSVASVVSLTAHEPISKIIDGVEYITFLYSHDRLVKEYTVRTDVDHVNLDDIVMDFRIQNAVSN